MMDENNILQNGTERNDIENIQNSSLPNAQDSAKLEPPVQTEADAAIEIDLDVDPVPMEESAPTENTATEPIAPAPAPFYPTIKQTEYTSASEGNAGRGLKIFSVIIALIVIISACVTGGYFLGIASVSDYSVNVDLAQKPSPEDAMSVSQVFDKLNPSVVGIHVYSNDSTSLGVGSGVVYSKDGYIVTNDHIYSEIASPKFKVYLSNGDVYDADYIAGDTRSDIAVLKLKNPKEITPAVFGNSNELAVGESVVAIGRTNGAGYPSVASDGIVSQTSVRAAVTSSYSSRLIQTDTATNPGSSGGALSNLYGQVIGITSSKLSGVYEGVSYAIPSVTVKKVAESLIKHKKVVGRGRLGISYTEVSNITAQKNNLPAGLKIEEIDKDSDLYGKSVKTGDIITHVNGTKITTPDTLLNVVEDSSAGTVIKLTVFSVSQSKNIEIKVKLLADEGQSSYKTQIADGNGSDSANQYNPDEFDFPAGE